MKVLEKDIQRTCLARLALCRRAYIWRNNTGGLYDSQKHFYRYGKVGSSDILGLVEIDGRGIFLAIEIKKPGGVLTDNQKEFLAEVNKRGGVGIVTDSMEDMVDQLKSRGVSI